MRSKSNQNEAATARQAVVRFIAFIANRFFSLSFRVGQRRIWHGRIAAKKIAWKRDHTWSLRKFKRGAFERRSDKESSKTHAA